MAGTRAYAVPGFPAGVGQWVAFPGLAELLFMPFFRRADADVFLRQAAPFQRALFELAPREGGYRYTYVDSSIQLLHPAVTALGTRSGHGIMEWHVDGFSAAGDRPSVFHAICSACTAVTEFNAEPLTIEAPAEASIGWLNEHFSQHAQDLGLSPRKMPAQRFVTWTTHVHRSTQATEREFRFFFRITESDLMPPIEDSKARSAVSVVHGLDEGWPVHTSIEHRDGKVVLHPTW